jgi:two-component system alkaline phosphatase synthesis response regulator PhoP
MDGSPATLGIRGLTQRIKQEKRLPVIALLSKAALGNLDSTLGIDDFVLEPWEATEVAVRAKRVLWRTNNIDSRELIKCGDLVIDLGKCEVSLDGRLVALTFKEYELLRFLASNKGRVFTREALLNKLWGYDYYGGDRTVDVHIRRLRSKIEDPTHTFIETVRNMGYRFKKEI